MFECRSIISPTTLENLGLIFCSLIYSSCPPPPLYPIYFLASLFGIFPCTHIWLELCFPSSSFLFYVMFCFTFIYFFLLPCSFAIAVLTSNTVLSLYPQQLFIRFRPHCRRGLCMHTTRYSQSESPYNGNYRISLWPRRNQI